MFMTYFIVRLIHCITLGMATGVVQGIFDQNIDRRLWAIDHIILVGIKQLLSVMLWCNPGAISHPPPSAPDDSNRLRKFTDQRLQCAPGAAEARLRCSLAFKNITVSMLISGSHPFSPSSFPDGFMNQGAFSDQMLQCGPGAAETRWRSSLSF